MKYIIVDTWNGEGYSDSTHEVKEFENLQAVEEYCYNNALACVGEYGEVVKKQEEITEVNYYEYCIDEDYGAITYEEYSSDILAIAINPLINTYTLIRDFKHLNEIEELIKSNSEEYKEEKEIYGVCHHNVVEGDLILERVEFVDNDIDSLKENVSTLIKKLQENMTDLWAPNLEYGTIECIALQNLSKEDVRDAYDIEDEDEEVTPHTGGDIRKLITTIERQLRTNG